MKKTVALLICIMMPLLFAGCKTQNPDKIGTSTVYVDKDGKVIETIVEDFSMPYYDEAELKESIESQIADYNASAGVDVIKLTHFEVKNQIVKTQTEFLGASAYSEYNNTVMFSGTISEALSKGYSMDVILKNPSDENETIDLYQILTMQDKRVVILEDASRLRVPEKMLYVTDDTVVIDEYEVDAFENTDATIIIY